MDNNNNQAGGVKDAGKHDDVADLKQIEKWLENDISRLTALVNALNTDKELWQYLARWFHGRIINDRNRKAMENQKELFPKPVAEA